LQFQNEEESENNIIEESNESKSSLDGDNKSKS
jgi:hypothetical protein